MVSPAAWPKARHVARRLLQPALIAVLERRWARGGTLLVATLSAQVAEAARRRRETVGESVACVTVDKM